MHHLSTDMQKCIDECLRCYQTCLGTASQHCLELVGKHVEPEHFRLMLTCSEMCRMSAHLMLIGTPHHMHICAQCAEFCTECADDCERVGDMQACVDQCRRCAKICKAIAASAD
jgi:hypothetical protein